MTNTERAVWYFEQGYCCSQAILWSFVQETGFDRDVALKLGTAFCGGMGGMGQTCGAVTGAFMVLGLRYGMCDTADIESKKFTAERIQEFSKKFSARRGTRVCKELIQHDISTPQGLEQAKKAGVFDKECPKFIKDAAEILQEMLS